MVARHFMLFFACVASATNVLGAQRTFVATNGNDVNVAVNCGLAAPCRTFGSALTVTDSGGEIIVLDSGGYGRATIDKSVTIQAPAGVYAGVSVFGVTNGIDINTPGIAVVLQGLTINGQGGRRGIYLQQGASLRVESCVIANMAFDGIELAAAGAKVSIKDSAVRNNSTNGISARAALSLAVERTLIEGNVGQGLYIVDGAAVDVGDSTITQNSMGIDIGNSVVGAETRVFVARSTIAQNASSGIRVGATGAGVKSSIAVSASSIAGNAGFGLITSNETGAAFAAVSGSLISGNSDGVRGDNIAGLVTVAGNTVVRNAAFGFQQSFGSFQSLGNNVLRDNNGSNVNPQTAGVITTFNGI